jgi:hypothetical protein
MKAIHWNDEFTVEITSQGLAVLDQSKHSLDDFKRWVKKNYSFSLGGHNITLFLEAMSRENEQKKQEENKLIS